MPQSSPPLRLSSQLAALKREIVLSEQVISARSMPRQACRSFATNVSAILVVVLTRPWPSRALDGLQHAGDSCLDQCQRAGPCDWCGTGSCCRHGSVENLCNGWLGIKGMGHVCVNPSGIYEIIDRGRDDTYYGSWRTWAMCSAGNYATKFRQRVEYDVVCTCI